MATTDDPRRESESARQRLNAIAQELASRTTPEQLKEMAREKRDELTGRAKQKASEAATQAKATARQKVTDLKETAVDRGERMKEGAQRNPALVGGLFGGALGIGAGLLAKRFSDRRSEQWIQGRRSYTPDYGYQPAVIPQSGVSESESHGTGERLKENVSEKFGAARENVSGKFGAARERMGHAGENLRHRIPSTGEVKDRSRQYMERSSEHPWMLAAIGAGLGMLAARLIPESDAERRAFGEVKQRASERFNAYGQKIEERVAGDEHDQSEALTTSAMNEPVDTYSETGPSLH